MSLEYDILLESAIIQAKREIFNIFGVSFIEETRGEGYFKFKKDDVSYECICTAYMTEESKPKVYCEIESKTGFRLRIDWYKGNIESLNCFISCDEPVAELLKDYHFDSSCVEYAGDKRGFHFDVRGKSRDVYLNQCAYCYPTSFSYWEGKHNSGDLHLNDNSLDCSSDKELCFIDDNDEEHNLSSINSEKACLYLFGKMYQDPRVSAIKEFVIAYIESIAPGLTKIIEELNKFPAAMAEVAYSDSGLSYLEKQEIDMYFEKLLIPEFDFRRSDVKTLKITR